MSELNVRLFMRSAFRQRHDVIDRTTHLIGPGEARVDVESADSASPSIALGDLGEVNLDAKVTSRFQSATAVVRVPQRWRPSLSSEATSLAIRSVLTLSVGNGH